MFITYKVKAENQLNKNVKILKSDQGKKYESNEFGEFMLTLVSPYHNIIHSSAG